MVISGKIYLFSRGVAQTGRALVWGTRGRWGGTSLPESYRLLLANFLPLDFGYFSCDYYLMPFVVCVVCKQEFFRSAGRVNEARKFKWRSFCSFRCQSVVKNKQPVLECANPNCRKSFRRTKYSKSRNSYCSLSCAATVNNIRYPKRYAPFVYCQYCGSEFKKWHTKIGKYCSTSCKFQGQIITKDEIINLIKKFHKRTGRIPFKREFSHYHAARGRFGTWNNAIQAAGFEPNPVRFAKRYVANDGHGCDSLAEKIIDDWLSARKISHNRSFPYPGDFRLTADFKVGNWWIEFFGLFGEHKRYDELRKMKLNLVKKHKIKLIQIYPKHLFPENKLESIFNSLL